ncbi:FMN-binding protein [Nitrospirillum sp. BR 11752]|uniref:FMN-binding protein n=1 Tax=Nitrospirillum sp. BR 11752 TaxID=3104293 RepID=UPI002EA2DAFF|nr:FMN-binding protein [Nitrospirillum sp. BR 11752]
MRAPLLALAAPALVLVQPAAAAVYLTTEQAQAALFPGQALAPLPVTLTSVQADAIESQSGVDVRNKTVQAWRAADGGTFIVDEVLGKHEYITIALAISKAGAVQGLEILEYKESYGHEVRGDDWRAQFTGKTAANPVKLDKDITNISGATLSSRHVTDGVRRLLVTWNVALKP